MRKRLLRSTAISAGTVLALCLPAAPPKAADDCGVALPASTVNCNGGTQTGSFVDADGITYAVSDLTLVLDAGQAAEHLSSGGNGSFGALVITNNGTIGQTAISSGTATAGIFGRSEGGSVTIGSYGATIATVGDGIDGIRALSLTGGTVEIVSSSYIEIFGNAARGIYAWASEDVSVTSGGSIVVHGGGTGIRASSVGGSVTLEVSGAVEVTGSNAIGVVGTTEGSITATLSGTITAIAASRGASISGGNGTNMTTLSGNIYASGAGTDGLSVSSRRDIVLLVSGTVTTDGDDAYGVRSNSGFVGASVGRSNDVTISGSASITTSGSGSDALQVLGGNDSDLDVEVAGSLRTYGFGSLGILMNTDQDAALLLSGTVRTDGEDATGLVMSASRSVDFTLSGGAVATAGLGATAVRITSVQGHATVSLDDGEIGTQADNAFGVVVSTLNNTQLTRITSAIDIATMGAGSAGILATTRQAGLLAEIGGTVTTGGANADALWLQGITFPSAPVDGTVELQLSGQLRTTGAGAVGARLSSYHGDLMVALSGTAVIDTAGTGASGIDASSSYGGAITVINDGAVDSAGTSLRLETAGAMVLGNGGMLLSDSDLAVDAKGPGTFNASNDGTIVGRLDLTGQSDGFVNLVGGTWALQDRNGDSALADFGAGSDLFDNRGLFSLADWQAGAESGVLRGLETLRNAGTVSLADGEAGDRLTVGGDLAGLGGMLTLDVVVGDDLSPADRVIIQGNASGNTQVLVTNLGGLGAENEIGILLIDVGGSSTADAFSLAGGPMVVGAFTYDLLEYQEDWYLTNAVLPEVLPSVQAAHVAFGAWHAGLRSLDERMGSLHHLTAGAATQTAALGAGDAQTAFRPAADPMPSGLWGRSNLDRLEIDPASGDSCEQQSQVLQFGGDVGFRDLLLGDDLLILGVAAGLVSAEADFAGSDAAQDLEGWSAALYASWLWQGLHLDLVGKLDGYDIRHSSAEVDLDSSHRVTVWGGSLEAGYRLPLGGAFFAEPQLQLTYARAEAEDLALLGDDKAVFEDAESLRLRGGLRAGTELRLGTATLRPYLEASWVQEFLGESEATIGIRTLGSSIEGSHAEVGGGLTVTNLGDHFSLHLDADYVVGERTEGLQATFGVRVSW